MHVQSAHTCEKDLTLTFYWKAVGILHYMHNIMNIVRIMDSKIFDFGVHHLKFNYVDPEHYINNFKHDFRKLTYISTGLCML